MLNLSLFSGAHILTGLSEPRKYVRKCGTRARERMAGRCGTSDCGVLQMIARATRVTYPVSALYEILSKYYARSDRYRRSPDAVAARASFRIIKWAANDESGNIGNLAIIVTTKLSRSKIL